MIEADIFTENDAAWPDAADFAQNIPGIVAASIRRTPFAELSNSPVHIDFSIRLTDDATVQKLNLESRGVDGPTNVLAFQFLDARQLAGLAEAPGATLGDIALAGETIAREADDQQKSFADHATHLVVHGLLHLLGYDHQQESEAEAMEQIERDILATLGIADPYADPAFRQMA